MAIPSSRPSTLRRRQRCPPGHRRSTVSHPPAAARPTAERALQTSFVPFASPLGTTLCATNQKNDHSMKNRPTHLCRTFLYLNTIYPNSFREASHQGDLFGIAGQLIGCFQAEGQIFQRRMIHHPGQRLLSNAALPDPGVAVLVGAAGIHTVIQMNSPQPLRWPGQIPSKRRPDRE